MALPGKEAEALKRVLCLGASVSGSGFIHLGKVIRKFERCLHFWLLASTFPSWYSVKSFSLLLPFSARLVLCRLLFLLIWFAWFNFSLFKKKEIKGQHDWTRDLWFSFQYAHGQDFLFIFFIIIIIICFYILRRIPASLKLNNLLLFKQIKGKKN